MIERTPEQKQALRDAYAVLAGRFDQVLIVCGMHEDHETVGPDLDVYWHGGYMVANSLADFAKQKIYFQKRYKSEPQ